MSHRAASRRTVAVGPSRRSAVASTLAVALLLCGGAVGLQRQYGGGDGVLVPTASAVVGAAQRAASPLPTVAAGPLSTPASAWSGRDGSRVRPGDTRRTRAAGDRATRSRGTTPAVTPSATTPLPSTTTTTTTSAAAGTTAAPAATPAAPRTTTSASPAAPRTTTSAPVAPPAPPPAPAPAPPRAPSTGAFPNQSNTGVPAGTSLSPYTGPCTISADGTVIEAKSIGCDLVIRADGVQIRSSKLDGTIDIEDSDASVTVSDTEINGGTAHRAAIGYGNITVLRSHIYGAQHGVNCTGNCHIQDSYIHDQYVPQGGDWHLQPFLSNGASNVTLIHNTLSCTAGNTSGGGGCTANVSIFGDFKGNHNYLIDNNLMIASDAVGYCVYGGTDDKKPYGRDVSGIRYVNNVFQRGDNGKCGIWGPVTAFVGTAGSVWSNNTWEDGTPVNP